jgi:hypothetical protein
VGDSFFAYLVQVELMAFFSGYPLFYAVIRVMASKVFIRTEVQNRLVFHLPHAYALVATLYLFFQLKNMFPDYSFAHTHLPYLKAWAIVAVLFWIPALAKKPVWSLLHSLVFFFYILRDLLLQIFEIPGDAAMVKNDMKLFSVSLLFNLAAFVAILFASYLFRRFSKK